MELRAERLVRGTDSENVSLGVFLITDMESGGGCRKWWHEWVSRAYLRVDAGVVTVVLRECRV